MSVEKFEKVCEGIVYWWKEWWEGDRADAKIEYDPSNPLKADIQLLDGDGDDYTVGTCADAGLTVEWIGECLMPDPHSGKTAPLVNVNGVFIQAIAKHIVMWALG